MQKDIIVHLFYYTAETEYTEQDTEKIGTFLSEMNKA